MGCVVYYVATNGCHPFGISIQRQANIVAGNYNISQVHGSGELCMYYLCSVLLTLCVIVSYTHAHFL